MCVCVCVCVRVYTFIKLHHLFIYLILLPSYNNSCCELFQFSMFCVKCASDLVSVMYVNIIKMFNIPVFYVFLYEKIESSEEITKAHVLLNLLNELG